MAAAPTRRVHQLVVGRIGTVSFDEALDEALEEAGNAGYEIVSTTMTGETLVVALSLDTGEPVPIDMSDAVH